MLLTYAATGNALTKFGVPRTVKKFVADFTMILLARLAVDNVTATSCRPALVPDPIDILTRDESTIAQLPATPPTVATIHDAVESCSLVMKFAPVIVIVLLM
jgi:hypothetical protein